MYGRMRVRAGALMMALGLAVVACEGDGTGPDPDFDSVVTAEAVSEMMTMSEELAPALAGMQAASYLFVGSAAGAVLADGGVMGPAAARQLLEGGAAAASYIPPEYHGVTYVWSESEGYVASEDAGAPTSGVRLIFYAINPVTRVPVTPLNRLGYVDLEDESTEAMNRLAVLVVSDGAGTLADYDVESAFTFTQSSFEMHTASAGFLSDGTATLNFDFGVDMAFTETAMSMTQDFSMGLAGTSKALSFRTTLTGDPQTEEGTIEMEITINDGSAEVVFEVATDENESMDGEVRYQGTVVALIGGTSGNPTFTSPSGSPLTQEDLAGLEEVMGSLEGLFELADQVMMITG